MVSSFPPREQLPAHSMDFRGISPVSFRLVGQGRPLPKDFPYKGEWLVERRIFLYRPDDAPASEETEKHPVHQLNETEWCFGINSITLSRVFGIGSHEILAYNRRRILFLVGVDDVRPTKGATGARRYTFQIDERQGSITIEGTDS
jgi:hypothetical protein